MAQPFDSDFWGDLCPPALLQALKRRRRDRVAMLQHFAEAWARYVPQVAPGGAAAPWADYFTEDAQFSALLAVTRGTSALPAILAVGSLLPCLGAEGLADVNSSAALFDALAAHGAMRPESEADFSQLPFHPLFAGKTGKAEPRRSNPHRVARADLRTDLQTPPFLPWQHRARVLRFVDYHHCLVACVRHKRSVFGASGRAYLLTGALRYGFVTEDGVVLQLCVGREQEFVYCVHGDPIAYTDTTRARYDNEALWQLLFTDTPDLALDSIVPAPPSPWSVVSPEERAAMLCFRAETGEEPPLNRLGGPAFREYLRQWKRAHTAYLLKASRETTNFAGVEGLSLPLEVADLVLRRSLCSASATEPVRRRAQFSQRIRVAPRVREDAPRRRLADDPRLGSTHRSLHELGEKAVADVAELTASWQPETLTPELRKELLAGALLTRLVEQERRAEGFVVHLRAGAFFHALLDHADRKAVFREWHTFKRTHHSARHPLVQFGLQDDSSLATQRWPFLRPAELETALLWLDYSEAIFTALRFPGARVRVVGDEAAVIEGGNVFGLWDQTGRLYVPLPVEEVGLARGAREARVLVYAARQGEGWVYVPCGEGEEGSPHETVRRENATEWHVVSNIAARLPARVTELRAFAAARARLGAPAARRSTTPLFDLVERPKPAPGALAPPLEWNALDTSERRLAAHRRWWLVRCREAFDAAVAADDPALLAYTREDSGRAMRGTRRKDLTGALPVDARADEVPPLERLLQPDAAAWLDFKRNWLRRSYETTMRTAPAWIQTFLDPETAGPPPPAVTEVGRERDCSVTSCLNVATSCMHCRGRTCAIHASLHRCVACAHCDARVGLAQQCVICRLEVCRACADRREGTRCTDCEKLLGCPRTPHLVRGARDGDVLCDTCRAFREDREGGAACLTCGMPMQHCFCVRDFPEAPSGALAARAAPPPALALGAMTDEYAEDDEAAAASGPEYTCGVCEQHFRPAFVSQLRPCARCMEKYLCDKCVRRNCRHCAPCVDALQRELEEAKRQEREEKAQPPKPMDVEEEEEAMPMAPSSPGGASMSSLEHEAQGSWREEEKRPLHRAAAVPTEELKRMRDELERALCAWCANHLGRNYQRCLACTARICANCADHPSCPPCTRRAERPERVCAHCSAGARATGACAACQAPTCGCSRAQLCTFRGCTTLVRCTLEGVNCSRCARTLCRTHANRCAHCVARAESAEAGDSPNSKLKRTEAARTSELVALAAHGLADRKPTPYRAARERKDEDSDGGGPDQ